MKKYAIAPNGIWFAPQGEAHLCGFQMAFLRLAGCSVGCAECDTDYSVDWKGTPEQVADEVLWVMPDGYRDKWVWITGGEPYDRDLLPLFRSLWKRDCRIAVATSGEHAAIHGIDWLSVSPHGGPLRQPYGHEVKLVVGLNGLDPYEWQRKYPDSQTDFWYRYVQPLALEDGSICPESLAVCLRFLKDNPNWAMSQQNHKLWGVD